MTTYTFAVTVTTEDDISRETAQSLLFGIIRAGQEDADDTADDDTLEEVAIDTAKLAANLDIEVAIVFTNRGEDSHG